MTRTLIVGAVAAVLAGSASANTFHVGASNFRGFSDASGAVGFDADYASARSAFLNAPGFVSATDSLESFTPSNTDLTGFGVDFSSVGLASPTMVTIDGDFTPAIITDTDPQNPTSDPGGNLRDGTDGANMFYTGLLGGSSGTLGLAFDPQNVVRGFGFSITDLGDFGATLEIRDVDGVTTILDLGDADTRTALGLGDDDFQNGDHLWVSFISDTALAGVDIVMSNNGSGDRFSFDEFSILVVPVPPAFALAGLGLVGVALRRRKMMAG